jgi:hypothetical protein
LSSWEIPSGGFNAFGALAAIAITLVEAYEATLLVRVEHTVAVVALYGLNAAVCRVVNVLVGASWG